MEKNLEKLELLRELEGYGTIDEMVHNALLDDLVPGICVRENCDYIMQVEPDSKEAWCPACEENSVMSCLILMGY